MSGIRASAQWRLMAISVLVPIAAVAVFLISQDYQARRTATLTNLELKSAQINAQLEDFVNTAEAATSALATFITNVRPGLANTSPVSAGTLTPPDELLLGFLSRNPQFAGVSVVDSAGNTLASSRQFTSGIRPDYAGFLGSQGAGDTFAVSDVFVLAGENHHTHCSRTRSASNPMSSPIISLNYFRRSGHERGFPDKRQIRDL